MPTTASRKPVIQATDIRKTYGKTVAVDGVSFEVYEGEIFGLIGPNGAGKTTTMECIEGIRKPDSGSVSVLSLDPWKDARAVQNRIGVQLQQAQLQKRIKVWEAIDLWASLYPAAVDAEALLEQLGLTAKRDAWFMTLSGGQKQRLFIALALINDPELVFLDELTTGLDPQARHAIWDLVRGIKARGRTVFLTTHLMEEAERLCDRVALIEHGRLIAMDTPAGLVRTHCPQRTVRLTSDAVRDADVFDGIPGLEAREVEGAATLRGSTFTLRGSTFTLRGSTFTLRGRGDDFVSSVIHRVSEHSIRVRDFHTELPSLEDVFLKLTGRSIRD